MAKHVVKHTYWVNSEMQTLEYRFDSYDEAFLNAEASKAHTVKLYAPSGELLKERQTTEVLAEDNSTPEE